jgi:hypothetical protein
MISMTLRELLPVFRASYACRPTVLGCQSLHLRQSSFVVSKALHRKPIMKKLILISAIAAALGTPMIASAESTVVIGATGPTSARLDFKIVIPRVLFLAVGSGAGGTALTGNAAIDLVTFDYTANPGDVGTGAANAAGSVTGNIVPVRVIGNAGPITLTAATVGALSNGAPGDTIPWSQISAISSDATNFPSPVIPASGTGASSAVVVSSGTKITNRTATWTYSYANSTVVAAGTYGGAGTAAAGLNNGRVTYTATMP